MKLSVVGAGPAGLYLALLVKQADGRHDVTVHERNPPDATFGWGVVFSEETLGALRDADEPSFLEISDTFARWDAIDVTVGGQTLRSRGHSFSAIRRTRLLTILQQRCREVGVTLSFGDEVTDWSALAGDADLLVAADGVNSAIRRGLGDSLHSEVAPQGCKYIWFGTDMVFDAFRFIFTNTEDGLFQVHGYPFDERASTFIVECPEPVWRRAGLAEMSEAESIAFCEKLFATELAGHRLLSNRSNWLDFQRVHNSGWHDGNVVLVGDAAHTAHFTIGSGTKLAMEDSIALASALNRRVTPGSVANRASVSAALVDYELERQPVVERFQTAADESAAYFTRVAHHTTMAPRQFAFNLLTRSGRIGHANLAQRDPDFVRRTDALVAAAGRIGPRRVAPPPAFTPCLLAEVEVPNRIVRACIAAERITDFTGDGTGLVLSAPMAVTPDGRRSPDCATLGDDEVIAALAGTVDEVHSAGALVGITLGHAGRRGATRPPRRGVDVPLAAAEAWPLIAASPLPYGPFGQVPSEAGDGDLTRIEDAFAGAADLVATAGADVLVVDAAHGGLLAGFLSPLANVRGDRYGGPLEHRLRCPLDVVRAVRGAWPERLPLVVRLTVTDWAPGGLTPNDGVAIAAAMAAAGVTAVWVEAGQNVATARPRYGRGYLTALSDRVRSEAAVATIVGGRITTIDEVDTVIAAGRADLCVIDLPVDEGADAAASGR
jgi:anthraniloyl-CoA monooxygenase